MLCDRCQGQEATIHLSTIIYGSQARHEEHFCSACASQATQPYLTATSEPPSAVSPPPVTAFSKRAKSTLRSVHEKLAELDPIFHSFCANRGYTLYSPSDLWPSRCARASGKIDHYLHLNPDVTFLRILEKGFYPEMPWALEAKATPPLVPFPTLTINIFRALPFSALASVLEQRLEQGFSSLQQLTVQDIVARADPHPAPRPAFP